MDKLPLCTCTTITVFPPFPPRIRTQSLISQVCTISQVFIHFQAHLLPLDAANIIRCIAFDLEKSLLPSSTTPSFNAFGGKNEIQGPSSVVVGLIGTVIAGVFVRAIACLCFGCMVPVISLNIALAVSGRRHGRTFSNFDRVHHWLLLQRFQVQVRHFVTFFFYF